ncbi:MAG: RNA-directed DNA polymerase [Prevotella sp.]|nr:RNA-directed DNA polymerase [Prevotella sp.]
MDRTEITKMAMQMKTKEDLLSLLNLIKRAELEEIGLQDQFHPFTMKHINYYCNPNNAFHRYRQFKVKKKSGGFRLITTPRNRSFMMVLSAINELLKSLYTPSDYAMGFSEGRSVVSNASIHKGQNYVFNIDLKDFFPSIEQPRVWKRLQLAPFNFPEKIASLIAGMCSMKEIRSFEDGHQETFYVLPQGAPTSPIITNMICDTLDRRLAGLAKRFGLHYSRYADDITFSSMHYVYQEDGDFRKELRRIIADQHFTINDDKTRLQKKGARQEVTGIIVSDKLNVTQKYVRDVRNILYIWNRYGYPSALAKFIPKYKEEKGHVKKGNPNLENVIDGKLMYLKMVKGEEDSVYQRLHNKFVTLVEKMKEKSITTEQKVTYIETWALLEFEKKYSTEVVITTSENSHRYAHFIFGSKKAKASVNKNIIPDEEKDKKQLAISLCIDGKGDTFWFVHRIDKVIVPKKTEVDIDELNNDLNLLLNI